MKKINYFFLLVAGGLLASCGGTSSFISTSQNSSQSSNNTSVSNSNGSSVTTSSVTSIGVNMPSTISFENSLDYFQEAYNNELLANKETKTVSVYSGDIVDVLDIELSIFNDDSSFGKGTLTMVDDQGNTTVDNYLQRTQTQIDKIDVEEGVYDYEMIYHVEDFEKNLSSKTAYQDVASKLFVVSKEDAAGLDESTYVLDKDVPFAITFQHVNNVANYVYGFINDPYITQTGVDTFTRIEADNNVGTYKTEISYEVDGDLNDTITNTYSLTFTYDFVQKRLLSYEYESGQVDVSNDDPTDVFTSGSKEKGTLTYGEKTSAGNDVVDAEEYFLQDVDEIAILDESRTEVDIDNVLRGTSYLFALPKVYSPGKALAIDEYTLTPLSSSNPNIVAIDDGFFAVSKENFGEVTLTWSYYGKDDEGVYRNKTIEKTITISEYGLPKQIYLDDYDLRYNKNGMLNVGETYSLDAEVLPSEAKQDMVVKSSNSEVISVSIENGTITFNALKEGEATITVSALGYEDVNDVITIKVVETLSEDKILNWLLNNIFEFEDYGGNIFRLSFNEDGTGLQEEIYSSGPSRYEFEYTLEGEVLTIFNYSDDLEGTSYPATGFNGFECTILDDLSAIVFENPDTYSQYEFIPSPRA